MATADELNTLLAEVTLGVRPEDSKLKPLSPELLRWRETLSREVREAERRGLTVDIPAEIPDANLVD